MSDQIRNVNNEDYTLNLNFTDRLNLKDRIEFQTTTGNPNNPISPKIKPTHYRPHTKVEIFTDEDGEMKLKWTGRNMMTLAGGDLLARTLFNFDAAPQVIPNYNNELNLDETISSDSAQTTPTKVCLWAVGTDYCGVINSAVRQVQYHSHINPDWSSNYGQQWGGIVPFQFRSTDDDLLPEERSIYFGRKTLSSYYAYYFKKFDSDPQLTEAWTTTGAPIGSDVYEVITDDTPYTCVSMQMTLTKDDCRSWFYNQGAPGLTLNDARINCISLLTGWEYINSDGFSIYQNLKPLTLISFPNLSLIDLRLTVSIKYTVYF